MLKITEHNDNRMVLEDKRLGAGSVGAVFTALSAFSVLTLAYNTVDTLILGQPKDLMAWRYFGVTVFMLALIGLVFIGVLVTVHFLRGITFVIDKTTEEITLAQPHFFRKVLTSYSIYGVSHLDVETNDDVRAHGLIMVLRSGERVPIAAYAEIEAEPMETVIQQIRTFLRTVGGW